MKNYAWPQDSLRKRRRIFRANLLKLQLPVLVYWLWCAIFYPQVTEERIWWEGSRAWWSYPLRATLIVLFFQVIFWAWGTTYESRYQKSCE